MDDAIFKLPLNDPRWAALEVFRRGPKDLPVLIAELLQAPADDEHPALRQLTAAIYHQYSTVAASYACFAHLLDIYQRSGRRNEPVFFLAANIAVSSLKQMPDLPQDIAAGWLGARTSFERLAVAWMEQPAPLPRDAYDRCIAALAFAGHRTSRLWMDVIEPEADDPDSTNRTDLQCPHCRRDFTIRLFDEGAAVADQNNRAQPPDPPRPWPQLPHRDQPLRQHNPWLPLEAWLQQATQRLNPGRMELHYLNAARRLCAAGVLPETPPDEALCLLGAVLQAHGFEASARRFWRMLDTVSCPQCRSPFVAANGWWGFQP